MKKVVIYSQNGCSHCEELKNLLEQQGIPHTITDIDNKKEDWKIISESTENEYVPQVLIVDPSNGKANILAPDRDFDEVSECLQHIMTELYE
jgi:glutaredoxin|tara:strand:- start:661 stop:936 length:276 start_codon:yes stop_codon:yes gene_type:complete